MVHRPPLYDDDRIREGFKANTSTVEDFRFAQKMRDDYERVIAQMRSAYEELAEGMIILGDRSLPLS